MIYIKHLYKNSINQILLYLLNFIFIPLVYSNAYGQNEGTAVIILSVTFIIFISTLYFSDSMLGLIITSIIYYILVLSYHTDKTIYGIGHQGELDFLNKDLEIKIHFAFVLMLEILTNLFARFIRFLKNRIINNAT